MSAKKRTSLDAVFADLQPQSAPEAPVGTQPMPVQSRPGKRPGLKQQTAYLPEPIYEQLRRLGFEEKRKMHSYIMEGIDRVFRDSGLPSIKDLMP
jgi:hypothetical protein